MPPHASEACNESDGLWLPLIEYSVKSGVSLSTIRRKIKSNSIQYRLEKGRYLILFSDSNNQAARQPISHAELGRWRDEPLSRFTTATPFVPRETPVKEPVAAVVAEAEEISDSSLAFAEKAVKMVSDAFEHALREKDTRIASLEKQNGELEKRISELQLLVRVLEEKYEVRY
jgi:hypothetical protein